MKHEVFEQGIKIFDKSQFNPQDILECGQVFSFEKQGEKYIVYPQNQYAEIIENKEFYLIKTNNVDFFADYFDLSTDYSNIKEKLYKYKIMKKPIDFGFGIRILNQNLLETVVSFIISANNNINRIKKILNSIREKLGEKIADNIYSFPDFASLKNQNEEFFKSVGCGYRSKYLVKIFTQINPKILEDWRALDTKDLRKKLVELSGIGPKVADCIMLFGYHRGDCFPVDTWIEQMHNKYFEPLTNRETIRNNLVGMFGSLSGYAQQYLFYYQRSAEEGEK